MFNELHTHALNIALTDTENDFINTAASTGFVHRKDVLYIKHNI